MTLLSSTKRIATLWHRSLLGREKAHYNTALPPYEVHSCTHTHSIPLLSPVLSSPLLSSPPSSPLPSSPPLSPPLLSSLLSSPLLSSSSSSFSSQHINYTSPTRCPFLLNFSSLFCEPFPPTTVLFFVS